MSSTTSSDERPGGGDSEPLEPRPQLDDEQPPGPFTAVIQFFVVPLVVVALAVSLFVAFGFLTHDRRTLEDYLHEVRTGSLNRRWQAAYELSRRVAADPEAARASGIAPLTVTAFHESADENPPRVKRYLALVLGAVGDPESVPHLIEALQDPDAELRQNAAWALAMLGDRRAVEPLAERVRSEQEAGARKLAVYALGRLGDPRARDALRLAQEDPRPTVAWQAAYSLAQIGDASAREQLLQLLDRAYVAAAPGITPEQQTEAMLNALKALLLVGRPEDRATLERLAASDPDLSLRDAALTALEQLPTTAP